MSRPENQFTELQKLLGCKRYEQPPPGYFLSFSDKVLARLEAEEARTAASWWSCLINRFDAKPVLVCAYSMAVSGLLFMGFRLSQVFESELAGAPALGGPWLAATPTSPILSSQAFAHAGFLGTTESSSLSLARWSYREEPNQLFFPAAKLPFQSGGFLPHNR